MDECNLTSEFLTDGRIPSPEIQAFLRTSARYLGLSAGFETLLGNRLQLVLTQHAVRNPRYRARYVHQRRRRFAVHQGRFPVLFTTYLRQR